MAKLPHSQSVLQWKCFGQRYLWQRSLQGGQSSSQVNRNDSVALMCMVIQTGRSPLGHKRQSCTPTHTIPPGPLILSNPSDLNPLNVIIIIIIIITLGNSGNSTSSFNSQLGVQEQRRHALYDSGPGNPSPREGARRTRKAHKRKRWRRYGTDSKQISLSYCPWGASIAPLSHLYLRFNNSWGQPFPWCFDWCLFCAHK